METKSIKCDQCNKELIVDSKYPNHFSLELKVINTGINTSGETYMVNIVPPFEETKHFCNLICLSNWVPRESNDVSNTSK